MDTDTQFTPRYDRGGQRIDDPGGGQGASDSTTHDGVERFLRATQDAAGEDESIETSYGTSVDTGAGEGTTAEEDKGRAVAAPLVSLRATPLGRDRFELLQQWEGRVETVAEDSFYAVLKDLTTPSNPEEEAEFLVKEVSEPDKELLKPNALFYWSIGYRQTPAGQQERFSVVRFRRLPTWDDRSLKKLGNRARKWERALGLDERSEDEAGE